MYENSKLYLVTMQLLSYRDWIGYELDYCLTKVESRESMLDQLHYTSSIMDTFVGIVDTNQPLFLAQALKDGLGSVWYMYVNEIPMKP